MKDKLRRIAGSHDIKVAASWGFLAAFAIAFLLAVVLLVQDRTVSAGVASALALSMALFCFLPTLESFGAFGLKAKFRAKLDEADEVLALLREATAVSAKLQVLTLAWVGRMGSLSARTKMVHMAEINAVVAKLSLPNEKMREIQRPFVQMALMDLARAYASAVLTKQNLRRRAIPQLLIDARQNGAGEDEIEALNARDRELQIARFTDAAGLSMETMLERMEAERNFVSEAYPFDFTNNDRTELERTRCSVLEIMQDCIGAGNVTEGYLRANERSEHG